MSHFSVLVVGDVDYQMAPYHEFECDGIDDEFIQTIDETEDYRKNFEKDMREYQEIKKKVELGEESEDKLNWQYKGNNFEDYIENYCEIPVTTEEELDLKERHKYHYAIKKDGVITGVFNRTNPNHFWDYYVEGYHGLLLKDGTSTNQALKKDVDFEKKWEEKEKDLREHYREVIKLLGGRPNVAHPWSDLLDKNDKKDKKDRKSIDDLRAIYFGQTIVKAFEELKKKDVVGLFDSVEDYDCTEDEYVVSCKPHCLTWGIVKNREYYASGHMGWWGAHWDDKDPAAWDKEYVEIINSIGDDELITILDCHT